MPQSRQIKRQRRNDQRDLERAHEPINVGQPGHAQPKPLGFSSLLVI